jgi:hypothetical protein
MKECKNGLIGHGECKKNVIIKKCKNVKMK